MTRLNRVLEVMAKEQVDCVIIKDETTIRYVTGFSGDSSLFYLDRYKGILITDGRYTEQAKHEMKMFQVLEYTGSIWACAAELAKDAKVVGFDGACFTYSDYVGLKELLSEETYMQSVDFSGIRQIKDNKELEMMVHAARIADEAFFTGTAAEVTPIREYDDRQIGEGVRGPITTQIQKAYFDAVQGKDPKYAHWLTYVK